MAEKTTGASVAPAATAAPAVETTPAPESVNPIVEDAQADALGNIKPATDDVIKHKVSFTVSLAETGVSDNGKFFALRSQRFVVDGVARKDFPWIGQDGVATTSNRITKGWRCILQLISTNVVGRMLVAKTKGHPNNFDGAEELAIFLLTNMKISGEVVVVPAGSVLYDGSITENDTCNFNILSYSLAMGAEEMMFAKMLLQDIKEHKDDEMPLILE